MPLQHAELLYISAASLPLQHPGLLYISAAPMPRRPAIAHDCREPVMKDMQDNHQWDTYLLAHGLRATVESATGAHSKPKLKMDDRRPQKLLFHIGNEVHKMGKKEGEFCWPRGLAVASSGEIIIADTENHRVQTFNQYGVLMHKFGSFGEKEGEFYCPTGIAVTMNGEVMIADSKNRRIQIFTRRKLFKDSYATNDEPYSIAVDMYSNMIVGTTKRTIEIYRKGGKLVNRFGTQTERESGVSCPLFLSVNEMTNTIVVSDPTDRRIKVFNYTGDMLERFQPCGSDDGLTCIPTGIHVLINGQFCVCDSLNHTVSVFSDKGMYIKQLIGPTDGCGSVQQCATGPEGHLITTECSSTSTHCFKIFRYRECECHRYRPGSMKTPITPNKFPVSKCREGSSSQLSGL
ncbi:tripartite motif-containing protein 3-like isoform X2 [Watersipora subatra]|uniref:tripartite motif-containing protein 3-like isoform X2 n=1 Tax=Watersipora subatra TaxID=2589382 RepID=UPI00355AD7CC